MTRALFRTETLPSTPPITTRLGNVSTNWTDKEIGKFVKQSAESAYALCAAGDLIEGYITAMEAATAQGFSVGSVQQRDTKRVTCDGLQATPGTGTLAVGDFVVCGTVVAKDTALTAPARVCKATAQLGTTVPTDLTAAAAQIRASMFAWRVVSLGTGAGAVGSVAVIERVSA